MPLALKIQFDIVLYSLLGGIITGVLFDAYRLIRGLNVNKVIVIIEDILFWILATLVIFTFLLYVNYAFLNPYVYIFLIIGLAFYMKLISPKVVKIEKTIGRGTTKAIRISAKSSIYPIKVIWLRFGSKSKEE